LSAAAKAARLFHRAAFALSEFFRRELYGESCHAAQVCRLRGETESKVSRLSHATEIPLRAARTEVRPDCAVKVRLSGLGWADAGLPARRKKKLTP